MCALSCPRLAGTLRRSALDLDRALQDCKPTRFGTVNGAYQTVILKKEELDRGDCGREHHGA